MGSKFVENLSDVPITHPHLNVLAEEGRKRSASQSSTSSQTLTARSASDTAQPPSPTQSGKMGSIRRRALTLGSKKIRRAS